jgi:UDP-glucose 4-epimerase
MTNVLVVGGAGYIGSAVTAHLVRAGHAVTVFDDLSHGHRAAVPNSIELVIGDVGDAAALDAVFGRRAFEVVMHFAGLIEAGESMKVPERYFRANSAGALSLLEAMLRHGVGRLVFSSTAALFGDPERTPVTEDGRMRPTNAYGASKLLIEQMLPWMNTAHGLRFACLRYFNAAGARDPDNGEDHRPETHLIPLVLKVASGQRENVSVFGGDYLTPDGSCVRDYVHVDDLARAHLLAMHALGERQMLHYNLGNGEGFSVRQVIQAAREVTGHPIPCREAARRAGDPATLVASSASIRAELGWRPEIPALKDIIASAWEWHRRHPHGYDGTARQ